MKLFEMVTGTPTDRRYARCPFAYAIVFSASALAACSGSNPPSASQPDGSTAGDSGPTQAPADAARAPGAEGGAPPSGDAATVHGDASGADAGAHSPPDAGTSGRIGTTGKPCSSNPDCAGGVCSNTYTFTAEGQSIQPWSTPVCLLPLPADGGVPTGGNCSSSPSTNSLTFCDGANANDESSPGLCVGASDLQLDGPNYGGICAPLCHLALDGGAPTGCVGSDTCSLYGFAFDPDAGAVTAYGFCEGSCQRDADCAMLGAAWGCQQDLGLCTNAKKNRSKVIGATCTNAGPSSDTALGACDCIVSLTTSSYCTSACAVGGAPCPNGYVCDAHEPSTLTFPAGAPDGGDLTLPGPNTQAHGLRGLCLAPCGTAGPGCPAFSTCMSNTVAGPDCPP
jgi:hypothetical protein